MATTGIAAAQQVFVNNLPIATGIATDTNGNVYVDYDGTFTTYISKFSRNRALLGRTSLGGITIGNLGHIARVPNSNSMLLLTNSGKIYVFGPTLQLSLLLDLTPLRFQVANNVFDVTTRRFSSLVLGNPNWGDIAAFRTNPQRLFLYLTATTGAAGGFPFVLRLDLDLQNSRAFWRVIARSTGTTAGLVNVPRGIAVNNAGWVLTGFPFNVGTLGFIDSLVAFRTSFPETATTATAPQFVLRTNRTRSGLWDMASVGMTTDAGGNFYVATGVVGSSLCGVGGSSGLVVIAPNPTIPNPRCFNLPAVIASSRDVAVSPVGNIPYMTAQSMVVRFNRLTAAAVASARSGGAAAAEADDAPIEDSKLLALRGARLQPAD